MRTRLVLVPALVAGLALSLTSASAAPTKTLDGKKVKSITWKANAPAQDNDPDLVLGLLGDDRINCPETRCAHFPFVFAPAKGVKAAGLLFTITWTAPVEDFDLYVTSVEKDGSYTDIGHCGASFGTSEKVYLSRANFKPGKKYALVANFYRTAGSTITGRVDFPGANTVATTLPAAVDDNQKTNCGL